MELWSVPEAISLKVSLLIELFSRVDVGVDETEAGRSTTTELALVTEYRDSFNWALVQSSKLGPDGTLGHTTLVWVDQFNVDLSSCQKRVINHLPSVEHELTGHL